MTSETVLVVEDDDAIGRALVGALNAQGFVAEWATTGHDAVELAHAANPALVLLDLGLPDLDGVEVCRRIRQLDGTLPILILTARRSEVDVVVGLDAGADDYITKPFGLAELLARVRAHLRRSRSQPDQSRFVIGDLEIDTESRRVSVAGTAVELRAREFDLLAFLASEAGNALTRERIMAEVWDEHWFGSTKTLDMHISAVRRKLGESGAEDDVPSRITTLRGVGYRLELP